MGGGHRAADRNRLAIDLRDRQAVAIHIRIRFARRVGLADQIQGGRNIFVQREGIIDGHRIVVDRVDGQRNGSRRGATLAIGDSVGKAVRAVIVFVRRIGHRAVFVDGHSAVRRLCDTGHRQCIIFRIGIVAENPDHRRRVFVQNLQIIARSGRLIGDDNQFRIRFGIRINGPVFGSNLGIIVHHIDGTAAAAANIAIIFIARNLDEIIRTTGRITVGGGFFPLAAAGGFEIFQILAFTVIAARCCLCELFGSLFGSLFGRGLFAAFFFRSRLLVFLLSFLFLLLLLLVLAGGVVIAGANRGRQGIQGIREGFANFRAREHVRLGRRGIGVGDGRALVGQVKNLNAAGV